MFKCDGDSWQLSSVVRGDSCLHTHSARHGSSVFRFYLFSSQAANVYRRVSEGNVGKGKGASIEVQNSLSVLVGVSLEFNIVIPSAESEFTCSMQVSLVIWCVKVVMKTIRVRLLCLSHIC